MQHRAVCRRRLNAIRFLIRRHYHGPTATVKSGRRRIRTIWAFPTIATIRRLLHGIAPVKLAITHK